MTIKDILLQEIETLPEDVLGKVMDYVKELKEISSAPPKKRLPGWLNQYVGVMKEKIDGVEAQRKMRDEWED